MLKTKKFYKIRNYANVFTFIIIRNMVKEFRRDKSQKNASIIIFYEIEIIFPCRSFSNFYIIYKCIYFCVYAFDYKIQ